MYLLLVFLIFDLWNLLKPAKTLSGTLTYNLINWEPKPEPEHLYSKLRTETETVTEKNQKVPGPVIYHTIITITIFLR